jgi:serine/threonine-protein kinase HipA
MYRKANVYLHNTLCGQLAETDHGYLFAYEPAYLHSNHAFAVSKTLPLASLPYSSQVLFPFFDGLIPEGWLLDIALDNWKVKAHDRFGLLLLCCKNTIGAVSIIAQEDEEL